MNYLKVSYFLHYNALRVIQNYVTTVSYLNKIDSFVAKFRDKLFKFCKNAVLVPFGLLLLLDDCSGSDSGGDGQKDKEIN